MKKLYKNPTVKILSLQREDILCNSVSFGGDKVEGTDESNRSMGSAPTRVNRVISNVADQK